LLALAVVARLHCEQADQLRLTMHTRLGEDRLELRADGILLDGLRFRNSATDWP
jgi:hypothetical protein